MLQNSILCTVLHTKVVSPTQLILDAVVYDSLFVESRSIAKGLGTTNTNEQLKLVSYFG